MTTTDEATTVAMGHELYVGRLWERLAEIAAERPAAERQAAEWLNVHQLDKERNPAYFREARRFSLHAAELSREAEMIMRSLGLLADGEYIAEVPTMPEPRADALLLEARMVSEAARTWRRGRADYPEYTPGDQPDFGRGDDWGTWDRDGAEYEPLPAGSSAPGDGGGGDDGAATGLLIRCECSHLPGRHEHVFGSCMDCDCPEFVSRP